MFKLVIGKTVACSQQTRKDVARFERALRKYGVAACMKAFAANNEGWGPSSILFQVDCGFRFTTVSQVDAAINAGRWAKAVGFTGTEDQQ